MKDELSQCESNDNHFDPALKVGTPLVSQCGTGTGGGTRAGLFRTPISGGVQSATSAHGLPPPALAVRNLMEQVRAISAEILIESFFFLLLLFSFFSLVETLLHLFLV